MEEKLNYSHIAPSGFGTGDMIVIGKDKQGHGLLHIVDYKNGKGIFVDADHNPQMMLYALGALRAYDYIYDVEIVRMSIVQPRLENISTCEMTVQELNDWAESIKPIALMAYEGKGEQKTGDWCRFCKAKPVCQACKEEALALCREDFLDLDAGAFDTAEESDMTAPYKADTQTAVDEKFVDVQVKRYIKFRDGKYDDVYVIRDGQKLTYEEALAAMPTEESDANG